MTKYKKTHQPCSDCGSSDALSYYTDGNTYCFSCGQKHSNATLINVSTLKKGTNMEIKKGIDSDMSERGISKNTCKFYNVTKGATRWYFPYYDNDYTHIANKTRHLKDKVYLSEGDLSSSTLFGQNLFNKGKYITLVEGEIDALSAFQMMGSKWPVVSIKTGAKSAVSDVSKNYDYLNQFDNIKICFDNDEPGRKAAKEVAELLLPKSQIVHLNLKDVSEYLVNNEEKEFQRLWWNSEKYTPEGIIAGSSMWDTIITGPTESSVQYPYEGLNKLTFGIRMGELITIAAGSGLGKSSFMREIAYHILNNTDHNIGLLFLEESVRRTAQAIVGLDMNKPVLL